MHPEDPKKLTIISGIGPDASGTGTLMRGLVEEAGDDPSTCFVHKTSRGRGPLNHARHLLGRMTFPWMVRRASRNAGEVVIFHPQTLGLPLFRQIVEARARSWIYVLDSSPFCVRSYNCLPAESAPCLRCLGNDGSAARLHGCENFFRSGPFQDYMPAWVRSGRLKLIAQCQSQAALLRAHFGRDLPVAVVPLAVPDIMPPPVWATRPARERPLAVYHGAVNHAKGIAHVISLARAMKEWDFLVPASIPELLHHFGPLDQPPPNLIFTPMSWGSGLAEQVQLADIVLCPSSWSAPVEGAVLKSLAHNGLVGLYVHETSFASEIPADARVCIDPKDMERAVATLRRLLKNPAEMEAMRAAARQFITRYAVDNRSMLGSLRSACGLD